MRKRYDFSDGIRGKYAARYAADAGQQEHATGTVGERMPNRPTLSHGHVSLLGDDDDELADDPMDWTPDNDPDQLNYNQPPRDDEDDEADADNDPEGEDDGDDTEDAPPSRMSVQDAANSLVQTARERFSRISMFGMPAKLRGKKVTLALFVQSDGRVKVLR